MVADARGQIPRPWWCRSRPAFSQQYRWSL